MAALIGYWLLFAFSLGHAQQRRLLALRSPSDWLLDSLGLTVQGALIPLLQWWLSLNFFHYLWPAGENCLTWPGWASFLIAFVGVDYLYYWVHRSLHNPSLFAVHQVHHSLTQMDMVSCARNTLWASLFLPYVWVNSLLVYCLANPAFYLLAISLTYGLDLWRHSCLDIPPHWFLYRWLQPWLILPSDHRLHHSQGGAMGHNFGANLKLWDKLHGTYAQPTTVQPLGLRLPLTMGQKLLWPFSVRGHGRSKPQRT